MVTRTTIKAVEKRSHHFPKGFTPHNAELAPLILPTVSKRQQRHGVAVLLVITDILSIIAAFGIASLIRLGYLDSSQFIPILFAITPIYIAIALNKQGYGPEATMDFGRSYRKAALAFCFACGSLLLIAFFLKASEDFSRILLGVGTLLGLASLALSRFAVTRIGAKLLDNEPFACLFIHDGIAIPQSAKGHVIDARLARLCPDPADRDSLNRRGEYSAGMDRVVVHCQRGDRQRWAFALKSLNIHAEIVVPELAKLAPLALSRHRGSTTLLLSSDPLGLSQRLTKRVFDICIAVCASVIALPLLAVIALLIKIESKGPAFFRQERIGIANRTFTIWKLRSMRMEVCDVSGETSTARDDHRLTNIGRFIRRTSIDELPQLWNVLRGDMSIVGPRPHASGSRAEDLLFWDIDERYWHRHAVKPGLTGLAQIRGYRGSTMLREDVINRLQADLEYVANWSLIGDIRIIFQTFGVLSHKNAY
jgi:polysaccharide biosynthesis protein PslA